MTTNIDRLIAGLSAKPLNTATHGVAPKAVKGGTRMPASAPGFAARMAAARAAKGKQPKAVGVKPLNTGTRKARKAKGTGPVQVPSTPVMPLTNTATNTMAGNTANGLHIHIHTDGGY